MAGGVDSALARGADEIDALGLSPHGSGIAVDLGAGFGMHAIALAERGFDVLAIDSCRTLVKQLEGNGLDLPIRALPGQLEAFAEHLSGRPELVLCMGDTLTHLENQATVQALVARIADVIEPGGRFITTFRDYSRALEGEHRFIPVRADPDRILTCFLEYSASHVMVHDILNEREGSDWKMTVSAYRKMRIVPDRFESFLEAHGFSVERGFGPAGMVQFSACLDRTQQFDQGRRCDIHGHR